MGTLWSLSKSATSSALDGSEIALLIFGLVLVIGAIGESAKSGKWKPWHNVFELLVILGVAGELLADGGIFVFSKHLQTISDREIASLNVQAAQFSKDAADARRDIANAKRVATEADARAAAVNEKAEQERLARVKIEERLAPRSLTAEQEQTLFNKLKPFAGAGIGISMPAGDAEISNIADQVAKVLHRCLWEVRTSSFMDFGISPVPGISISSASDSWAAADALASALRDERLEVNGPGPPPKPLPAPLAFRNWIPHFNPEGGSSQMPIQMELGKK